MQETAFLYRSSIHHLSTIRFQYQTISVPYDLMTILSHYRGSGTLSQDHTISVPQLHISTGHHMPLREYRQSHTLPGKVELHVPSQYRSSHSSRVVTGRNVSTMHLLARA
eukprot:869006-Rhodomonas_salina.3